MNQLRKIFIAIVFLSTMQWANAQMFDIGGMFRISATLGYEGLTPLNTKDSLEIGYQRGFCNFVIPVTAKAKLEIKNLNANIHFKFLNVNLGTRIAQADYLPKDNYVGNSSIGLSGVYGKLLKGLFFYTVQVGTTQSLNNIENPLPFGIALLTKIKIKGLRKQNFIGAGLAYSGSNNLVLPFPIIGWNRKFTKKSDIQIVLPALLKITYKNSKKIRTGFQFAFSSFGSYMAQPNNIQLTTFNFPDRFSYNQAEVLLNFYWKLSKDFHFYANGGMAPVRRIQLYEDGDKIEQKYLGVAPKIEMGIKLNIGKELVNSAIFGNDF